MDRTDTTSDEYQALLAQLVKSHDHGYGRFRRMAWGAKEDCEQCMTQEKLMAEAREDFKVRFTDGTTAPVVDGLIGLTEDEEFQRGQDAWDSDDVFDFDAQSVYFQEGYKEAWFDAVRPNTDGDNCEQAWGHQLDDLYWRFKEQQDKKVNNIIGSCAV